LPVFAFWRAGMRSVRWRIGLTGFWGRREVRIAVHRVLCAGRVWASACYDPFTPTLDGARVALEPVSNQSAGCPHGSGTAATCAPCRALQHLIEAQRRDAGSGGDRRALRVWGDDAWGADEAASGTGVLARARSVFTEVQRQRGPSGTVAASLKHD